MSIVEKAARRLEELKRAGVEIDWQSQAAAAAPVPPTGATLSPVRQVMDRLEAAAPTPVPAPETFAPAAAPAVARRSREVRVDLARMAAAGYMVPTAGRSRLADELRVIKRPLLETAWSAEQPEGTRGNLIFVTSALPGEGKTFFSINLAMSIAMEVDYSVLLVDADVAKPSIPARLGIESSRGLMDVLADPSIDLGDVMLRTDVAKLSVLPAGTPSAKANELLASGGMERLLQDLSSKYADRIIIFDGPPLLATTEARVLARRMGQVLVVVEADRTPQQAVSEAFAALAGCANVLSVLNKVPSGRSRHAAYGYGAQD